MIRLNVVVTVGKLVKNRNNLETLVSGLYQGQSGYKLAFKEFTQQLLAACKAAGVQRLGVTFAANDWATIFPSRTTNVSVAAS